MINEKRLDEIVASQTCTDEEEKEIIRLARLGLWARDHGIPSLRWIDKPDHYEPDNYTQVACFQHRSNEALSALPKDTP